MPKPQTITITTTEEISPEILERRIDKLKRMEENHKKGQAKLKKQIEDLEKLLPTT